MPFCSMKVDIRDISNPVSRILDKNVQEENLRSSDEKRLSKGGEGLGRKMFPTAMWASGKVEDTPHGFLARVMSRPQRDIGVQCWKPRESHVGSLHRY
jgi:hypothetical protein